MSHQMIAEFLELIKDALKEQNQTMEHIEYNLGCINSTLKNIEDATYSKLEGIEKKLEEIDLAITVK